MPVPVSACLEPGRATQLAGAAVPYAVAVAIFGGTAPYLQSWSNAAFGPSAFTIYVVVLLIISTVVAWKLPETKGKDLTQLQRCAPASQRPESLTAPCRPATMSYERIRS